MEPRTREAFLTAIAANGHDPEAKLKQIAGLIRSLPYRDMNKLGTEVFESFQRIDAGNSERDLIEGLLTWAEEVAAA